MSSSDYYAFGHQNDRLESQRLTQQHFLFTDLVGHLIHPSIISDLTREKNSKLLQIADVACGNGIWSHGVARSDLASEHILHVTALDLTDKLFPPVDERPSNVEYGILDLYEAVPERYQGTFDLVNIRLFFGALQQGDPTPILKNLLKLLKPGGWIQWCESEFDTPVAAPNSMYLRIPDFFKYARPGHSNAWITNLGQYFDAEGMEFVNSTKKFPDQAMYRYWKDTFWLGLAHLVSVVKNEKVDDLWQKMEEERASSGMSLMVPVIVVFGRKPGR